MERQHYGTDLTEAQWQRIAPYLERPQGPGRKNGYELREIVNAILYLNHTGCQWSQLPHDLPPWWSVYYHFRKWQQNHTWFLMHQALHQQVREQAGKAAEPTAAILDSQSVPTTSVALSRGFDGHKKVKGRKRHLVVDTLGFPLVVKVTDANLSDSKQAFEVLETLFFWFTSIQLIWADAAYQGALALWLYLAYQCRLEIAATLQTQGFQLVPKRWIVERTFGWFEWSRRLQVDYERYPQTAETMVYVASIRILLNRLN